MHFLDPYRSLFTIAGGIVAIITFYVILPIPDVFKFILVGGVVAAVIALLFHSRRGRRSLYYPSGTSVHGSSGAVFTLDESDENTFEGIHVADSRDVATLKKSSKNVFRDIDVGRRGEEKEDASEEKEPK